MIYAVALSLIMFCAIKTKAEDCCHNKNVGNYNYTFVKTNNSLGESFGCKDGCIYYRDDSGPTGTHWCFANGGMVQPKCLKTTYLPVEIGSKKKSLKTHLLIN